ncbi:hypothetical protein BCD49_32655 [Pseudofrankia sp. EUN1h]|nr:hypothetical protein BCD49_32655 [Pseudofrankia sp. EUN1h]
MRRAESGADLGDHHVRLIDDVAPGDPDDLPAESDQCVLTTAVAEDRVDTAAGGTRAAVEPDAIRLDGDQAAGIGEVGPVRRTGRRPR